MTAVVERALATLSRPLVIAWAGVDRQALTASWRAAAIRRAARLRGAYRDLDPRSVPGSSTCAELHRALGVDPKNPLAGDVLLSRALTADRAFEPEPGAELSSLIALELLVPIAVRFCDGLPDRVDLRFGRDGERLEGESRSGETAPSIRARAVVCRNGRPWVLPAWRGREENDERNRDLVLVAFLAAHDCGEARVTSVLRLGEEVMRARATSHDLATIDAARER